MTLLVAIVAASPSTGAWIRRALETESGINVVRGTTLFDYSPLRLRKAHVLVVDHELPFDLIRQLMRIAGGPNHAPGVVVVGAPADIDRLADYIEHGLRGYVLDSEPQAVLVDVVKTVGSGEVRLDSWLAGAVVERYRQLRARVNRADDQSGNGGHPSPHFDR